MHSLFMYHCFSLSLQSIRRANGPMWTIRASQKSSLYATVGPPVTTTSLSDPDGVRWSGDYDMPTDVHIGVGGAVGRSSNVYEVPHDVSEVASQSGNSRSNSLYEAVARIRRGLRGSGTRQNEELGMRSSSPLQDGEGAGEDALIARGYETPQSAQERYSRELEELAQSASQDNNSTGYEVCVWRGGGASHTQYAHFGIQNTYINTITVCIQLIV